MKFMKLLAAASVIAISATGARADLVLQMGTGDIPAFGLPYVADKTGAFEAADLNVTINRGRTSQDAINTLIRGDADIAYALSVNHILTADKGQDLLVVGHMYGRNGFGVIAGKETGITDLVGLEGKTILLPGALYETLLRALIADAGGDPDKVTYTIVSDPAAMIQSYAQSRADAVTTVIPFAVNFAEAARPSNYIQFADAGDPEPLFTWVTTKAIFAEKHDEIARFVNVMVETMGAINADPQILVKPYMDSVLVATEDKVIPGYLTWAPYQCAEGQTQLGKPMLPLVDKALALYKRVGLVTSDITAADITTDELFAEGGPITMIACPE